MPRKKRSVSPPPFEDYNDDDFDDEISSNGSKNLQQPPIQRNAANARERARMRVLSSAFCRLKTKLPWVPADTKLSKLDTLRLAKIYIEQLRARLAGEESGAETLHPQNLIWLGFQQHMDIAGGQTQQQQQQPQHHSSSSSSLSSTTINHLNQSQWLSSSSSSSRDSPPADHRYPNKLNSSSAVTSSPSSSLSTNQNLHNHHNNNNNNNHNHHHNNHNHNHHHQNSIRNSNQFCNNLSNGHG